MATTDITALDSRRVCLRIALVAVTALLSTTVGLSTAHADEPAIQLDWDDNYLTISSPEIAGESIRVHYLEAYCRAGSTDADWVEHTLVGHRTELVERSDDAQQLKLRCKVADGLQVEHVITASEDEVSFHITAHNPTERRSEAHWAQPCVRLDKFTGADQSEYLEKSFIFVDGELRRMPFEPWATEARYTPGQVWRPESVPASDVNPRPLSSVHPSHGLIGCFSHDQQQLFAVAFEPYQELFQGVAVCLHSDFRLGGLRPGEQREIRGKMYFLSADVDELLRRYARDFPTNDHP